MKNVLTSILLLSLLYACHSQPPSGTIGPGEFEKGIAVPDVQVLDVRTAGEYKSGHIRNALLADWNNQAEFTERIKYVDKNKPVYIYCLAGGRSKAAANWMRSNGFKRVVELQGGMNAWKQNGKPVEGSSNEPQMTLEQYLASIPNNKTVLVDFGASWCPPCIKMNPVIDELEKTDSSGFQLLKIDAGIHTDLMKDLDIEQIPVFIIYKNGAEVWRKQGIVSREEFLKNLK